MKQIARSHKDLIADVENCEIPSVKIGPYSVLSSIILSCRILFWLRYYINRIMVHSPVTRAAASLLKKIFSALVVVKQTCGYLLLYIVHKKRYS